MFINLALTIILVLSADGFCPSLSRRSNSNINININNKRGRVSDIYYPDPFCQLKSTIILEDEESAYPERNTLTNKEILKKVLTGFILAPTLLITPFYGIGFMAFGPDKMWNFSEWIYSFAKSSEVWLFDTFRRTLRFLSSGTQRAQKAAWAYRIHPLFAGISLISTAILSFADAAKYQHVISRRGLLIANAFICFISATSGKELASTMMGATHAKKWIKIQANTCIAFATLAISPSLVGSIMVYLNWSLLFAVGVLERLYVLCILSQFRIQDRKEYTRRYSPQFKVACLASIPLGIITFWLQTYHL